MIANAARRFLIANGLLAPVLLGPALVAHGEDAADAGFMPLLIGNDLAGWMEEQHSFFREKHPNVTTWSVQDGVLHCDGSRGNTGFLRYGKQLGDFVLRLEFRLAGGCNSGVGLRSPVPYTTLKPNTLPSTLGYEFQIMDDAGQPISKKCTGAFYGQREPIANAARPAGEWNTLEIECRGPRIRATLNGVLVQDMDQTQVPALADRPLCGFLSLQNHGRNIDFRAIRLKELAK